MIYIELDAAANRWCFAKGSEEQRVWKAFAKGKGHQHEAAILLCLAELPEGDALPIHAIQTLVQDWGRDTKLNATGLKRLYESINHAGEIAGQEASTWAWRVIGHKTTGAWGLQLNDGIQISKTRLPASPHPHFLPAGLTADSHDCEKLVCLLRAILSIDLALNGGDVEAALLQCETLLQSDFLSHAARLLIQVKMVHILLQLRRFTDAKTLLNECGNTTDCPMLKYLAKEAHFLLRTRMRYDRDGSTLSPSELQNHINTLNTQRPTPFFGLMEAERRNLLGLLHYRQAKKCSDPEQQQLQKRAAIHHFHGALLLALATSNYQWMQRFVYNLSLVAFNPLPLLDYAHDVGERMQIGRNSQWILLTLCKQVYWRGERGKPITNAAIENLLAKMGMPPVTLPAFWLELVKRTQPTHNPREIGNAYFLAQWGLNRIHAVGESRRMQASLDALRKGDAELARVLKADFGGWKKL